jgi:hypothetical protein
LESAGGGRCGGGGDDERGFGERKEGEWAFLFSLFQKRGHVWVDYCRERVRSRTHIAIVQTRAQQMEILYKCIAVCILAGNELWILYRLNTFALLYLKAKVTYCV